MPDRLVLPIFVVLWSSGYVVGALAIGVADPLPLLALRFTLAALVAVPLALRSGRWRGAPAGPARRGRRAAAGRPVRRRVRRLRPRRAGGARRPSPCWACRRWSRRASRSAAARSAAMRACGPGSRSASSAWPSAWRPSSGSARVGVGVAVTLVGMLGLASATVLQKRWGAVADPRVSVAAQAVTGRADRRPRGARLRRARRRVGAARALHGLAGLGHGHRQPAGPGQHPAPPRGERARGAAARRARRHRDRVGRSPSARRCIPASLLGMLVAMAGIGAVLRREAEPAPAPPVARAASLAGC